LSNRACADVDRMIGVDRRTAGPLFARTAFAT
jgi:hypothetical protein